VRVVFFSSRTPKNIRIVAASHWTKKGLIYCAIGAHGFDRSHCHKPTPLLIASQR
jgi:hypothetical protein